MVFLIIAGIAVVITAYFMFFSGNQDGSYEAVPQIKDMRGETSVVEASVKNKYLAEDGRKRLIGMVVFECDDGEEREFTVNRDVLDAISIGECASLIYSDRIFLGFGEHGAAESDVDESDLDDNFSYDDYDENIDIEQVFDQPDEQPTNGEDTEYLEQFRDRVKLPPKSETVSDETDAPAEYQARELLQKTTLYPFLKQERKIRLMFERTYSDALTDMLGFEGNSRKGLSADSEYINKNEIRVVITIQECPPPLKSKITAEFGINE